MLSAHKEKKSVSDKTDYSPLVGAKTKSKNMSKW